MLCNAVMLLCCDAVMLFMLRCDAGASGGSARAADVIPLIAAAVDKAGLYDDLPYTGSIRSSSSHSSHTHGAEPGRLSFEQAEELLAVGGAAADAFTAEFSAFVSQLSVYLAELENRLFSEGLHEIGAPSTAPQLLGYVSAVSEGSGLSNETLHSIVDGASSGLSTTEILLEARAALDGGGSSSSSSSSSGSGRSHATTAHRSGGSDDEAPYDRIATDLWTAEDRFGFSLLKGGPHRGGQQQHDPHHEQEGGKASAFVALALSFFKLS